MAVSEFTKNDIIENGWASASKISVVYNSFDAEGFTKDEAILPVETEDFLEGRGYFLCVGHLEPRKNLKRIITAYSRYRNTSGEGVALVIVGKANASFITLIEDALEGTEYAKDVLVTGFVEDQYLPGLYKKAELFLFPSLHEGFGIPVLEAMAAETPVITSNSSALPEVAGGAALLVDPSSIDEIEQGISRIMNDPAFANQLVVRGRENLERFNCHSLAEEMTSIVYSLVNK